MIAFILASTCLFAPAAAASNPVGSHSWVVNEIFSSADGAVQFVELRESNGFANEINISGLSVTCASTGNSFTFPANLPAGSTANQFILLGTANFAALPGAPPVDHIIPAGFFDTNGDTLQFHVYTPSILSFGAGQLPLDGFNSLSQSLTAAPNSPTNFAGQSGQVNLSGPPVPSLPAVGLFALIGILGLSGAVMVRRRRTRAS